MAVKTQPLSIGPAWVQVSDGTQTKTIQVHYGAIRLVDADSNPGVGFWLGHMISDDEPEPWATITPPTIAWIRSAATDGEPAEVSIS